MSIDMINKTHTPIDSIVPSLDLVAHLKAMPQIAHTVTTQESFDLLKQSHNSYMNTITIRFQVEQLDKTLPAVFAHAKETALHNMNTTNKANNVSHITILLYSGGVIKWLTISVHQGRS